MDPKNVKFECIDCQIQTGSGYTKCPICGDPLTKVKIIKPVENIYVHKIEFELDNKLGYTNLLSPILHTKDKNIKLEMSKHLLLELENGIEKHFNRNYQTSLTKVGELTNKGNTKVELFVKEGCWNGQGCCNDKLFLMRTNGNYAYTFEDPFKLLEAIILNVEHKGEFLKKMELCNGLLNKIFMRWIKYNGN